MLDDCPNLKLISTRSTGVDHDVAACNSRGSRLQRPPVWQHRRRAYPGPHSGSLAQPYPAVDRVSMDYIHRGLVGFTSKARPWGRRRQRIGLHVIRIGRAMNMQVLRSCVPRPAGRCLASVRLSGGPAQAVRRGQPSSRCCGDDMIDAEKFALMSQCDLVNTSRGGVVDGGAPAGAQQGQDRRRRPRR